MIKRLLWRPYYWFSTLFFDPLPVIKKYRALPYFIKNWKIYARANRDQRFKIHVRDIWYCSQDRFEGAGTAQGHYFFQDLWAAKYLFDHKVKKHVDVGSRMDGFIAHVLPFCSITYVDIRPLELNWPNFEFRCGSITEMPYEDEEIESLSSLHVIEHIGLGRYGDTVNPDGYLKAAEELSRVLAPGGRLVLGTPVGKERLCYDAHRVFDPQTIIDAFSDLDLEEFWLIDDYGKGLLPDSGFLRTRNSEYGCGLFVFTKKASVYSDENS